MRTTLGIGIPLAYAAALLLPNPARGHGIHAPWLEEGALDDGVYVAVDTPKRIRRLLPFSASVTVNNVASDGELTIQLVRWFSSSGELVAEKKPSFVLPTSKGQYKSIKLHQQVLKANRNVERATFDKTVLADVVSIAARRYGDSLTIDPLLPAWQSGTDRVSGHVEVHVLGPDGPRVFIRPFALMIVPPLPTDHTLQAELETGDRSRAQEANVTGGSEENVAGDPVPGPGACLVGDQQPCWYAGDQHLHTKFSIDAQTFHPLGSDTATEYARTAQDLGLDWITLTDHANVDFVHLFEHLYFTEAQFTDGKQQAADATSTSFVAMYGEELGVLQSTSERVPAHLLAYPQSDASAFISNPVDGPDIYWDDWNTDGILSWLPEASETAEAVISRVNLASYLGVIAHPFANPESWNPNTRVWQDWTRWNVSGFAGLEIWSDHEGVFKSADSQALNKWHELLREIDPPLNGSLRTRGPDWPNRFPVGFGNSDAHTKADIGNVFTYCWMNGLSTANVREATKSGHCVASNGPLGYITINGKGPGQVASVQEGVNFAYVHVNTSPEFDSASHHGVRNFELQVFVDGPTGGYSTRFPLDAVSDGVYSIGSTSPDPQILLLTLNSLEDRFITTRLVSNDPAPSDPKAWQALANPIWLEFTPLSSIVVRDLLLSPSTVDPLGTFQVSGRGEYSNGAPVVAGTATITIEGGNTYTAAVSSGQFSRPCQAPANPSSNSITRTVTARVTDGQANSGQASTTLTVLPGGQPGGSYDLYTDIVFDYQGELWLKDVFTTRDTWIGLFARFENTTGPGLLDLKWTLLDRSGQVFKTTRRNDAIDLDPGYDDAVEGWPIAGQSWADFPGNYGMELYVDDQRKARLPWTLGWDFNQHRMCRQIDDPDGEYLCGGPTNVFTPDDEWAIAWHNFELVAEDVHTGGEFVDPSGTVHTEGTFYMDYTLDFDLPQHHWYWWYRHGKFLSVRNSSARYKCGNWAIRFYVQRPVSGTWDLSYTDYFQIHESVAPSVSAALSPSSPEEGDNIALSIFANDNNHLDRVVVHWNDGTDHAETWSGINASARNGSSAIGPMIGGTELSYWAEVWDESGNRTESDHVTVMIRPGKRVCCIASGACSDEKPANCGAIGGLGGPPLSQCASAPDCDDDGIVDACALLTELSNDCDHDAMPDECNVAFGAGDCNGNLVPDGCEGDSEPFFFRDGVPDPCDNCPRDSNWAQLDSDLDGVGDECDLCSRTQVGAETNEVGCSGDCDGDGDVDLMDCATFTASFDQMGRIPCDLDKDGAYGQRDWARIANNLIGPSCCTYDACAETQVCARDRCLDEESGEVIVEDFADNENPSEPGFDPRFHHSISEGRITDDVYGGDGRGMRLLLMGPWIDYRGQVDHVSFNLPSSQAVTWASVTFRDWECGGGPSYGTGVSFYGSCGSWTGYPRGGETPTVFDTSGLKLGEIVAIHLFSNCIGEYFRIELRVQERP